MPLISAADLQRVQGFTETLGMPDSYALQRDTPTSDNAGGYHDVPATIATGPCRLRMVNQTSQEQVIASQLQWIEVYAVDLPLAAQPKVGDRLIINSRTFEIGGILRGGLYQVQQVCVVRERG